MFLFHLYKKEKENESVQEIKNLSKAEKEKEANTYNNRKGSFVFDTTQGNFKVNNTYRNENVNFSGSNGNSVTVLPPGTTSFEGSTNGNLIYGMENSSVNAGIENNLPVNGN